MSCGAAKFSAISLILTAFSAPADAEGTKSCDGLGGVVSGPDTQVLCTRLIDFNGVCGRPNLPGLERYEDIAVYLNPWEDESITVREVQVSTVLIGPVLNGQPQPADLNIGVSSGNSYNSDPMTPYEFSYSFGARAIVIKAHDRFPQGTGMQFPGKSTNSLTGPHGDHLDVHVDCGPAGASYFGKWFLAYTINRDRGNVPGVKPRHSKHR